VSIYLVELSSTPLRDHATTILPDLGCRGPREVVVVTSFTRCRRSRPDLAGSYAGLPTEDVFLPSLRLLGDPATYYDHLDGKIAILGCVCGEPGCRPFRVKIALRDEVVIWSGFEQPQPAWRYDEMQPFVFDRTQYLSALCRKPG
jgi:hypothetical protein